MDILSIMMVFFLLATIIKIATDNVEKVVKPFVDVKKFKLVIAMILTGFAVAGLNFGMLDALEIPLEVSRSWFHYFDIIITTLFLTGGAQAIHKLNKAWSSYRPVENSNVITENIIDDIEKKEGEE